MNENEQVIALLAACWPLGPRLALALAQPKPTEADETYPVGKDHNQNQAVELTEATKLSPAGMTLLKVALNCSTMLPVLTS